MAEKMRLDQLLFDRGLAPSRERARTTVMSGLVFVAGRRVDKPGQAVPVDAPITVKGDPIGFVSRGGLKLQKAVDAFGLDLKGVTALDAGASTGGFTDCMLKHGAEKVFAVDVGYGQLAWSLRTDGRVVCMERTNIRKVTPEALGCRVDFASADLSFISLKLVLPVVRELLKPQGRMVCLIKPQFEAGKEKVGKKGVVRDPQVHREVLEAFLDNARAAGFGVRGLTFSPVKGPEGNIEYLGYLGPPEQGAEDFDPAALVEEAHRALDRPTGEGERP